MTSLRFRQMFTVSPGDRKVQIKVWIRCVRRDLIRTKAGQCDNGQPQPIVWADCYDLWSDSWRHVNPKKQSRKYKHQSHTISRYNSCPRSHSKPGWLTFSCGPQKYVFFMMNENEDWSLWVSKICKNLNCFFRPKSHSDNHPGLENH